MTTAYENDWLRSLRPQQEHVTAAQYEALSEEVSRRIEIVDGYVFFCEAPTRAHQKAAHRLAILIEDAARLAMSRGNECIDVHVDVDLRIQDVPLTNRQPDVVLHRCLDQKDRLGPQHVLLIIEIVSPGSETVDTADKFTEYARAGIPHYWIVRLDDIGVSIIDRHQLDPVSGLYKHVDTFVKDDDAVTVEVTDPIPIDLEWPQLEF